jgi:glucoamylase
MYWKLNHKIRVMPAGKKLRIELVAPATIHWSSDDWNSVLDMPARDTGIGLWAADLPTELTPPGAVIRFTLLWNQTKQWEGKDFEIRIIPPSDWVVG